MPNFSLLDQQFSIENNSHIYTHTHTCMHIYMHPHACTHMNVHSMHTHMQIELLLSKFDQEGKGFPGFSSTS